jgi:hypothetical protein
MLFLPRIPKTDLTIKKGMAMKVNVTTHDRTPNAKKKAAPIWNGPLVSEYSGVYQSVSVSPEMLI